MNTSVFSFLMNSRLSEYHLLKQKPLYFQCSCSSKYEGNMAVDKEPHSLYLIQNSIQNWVCELKLQGAIFKNCLLYQEIQERNGMTCYQVRLKCPPWAFGGVASCQPFPYWTKCQCCTCCSPSFKNAKGNREEQHGGEEIDRNIGNFSSKLLWSWIA